MRRLLLIAVLLAVLLSVVLGAHVYLAQRLILDLQLAAPLRTALLWTLATLAALMVLQPIAQWRLSRSAAQLVTWPATVWMGLAFFLLITLALSDLGWWLAGTTALADVTGVRDAPAAARVRAFAVFSVALVAGAIALRHGLRAPVLQRVELRLPEWPGALDGFRIVQITDIHIGPLLGRRFAEHLVTRCNALAADLIAITGDLVDGRVSQLIDEVAPFAGLTARHGVFFVTGNHDYYSGANHWAERARALGMQVLRNERVTIGSGDAAFELAGVDDHHGSVFGGSGEDLPRAVSGRDPQRTLVLLAHDPATFHQAAALGVDLQLSGHTHGGQLWPFAYLVRLATPFVAGHYRRNNAQLYVSRGTGFWGPPMRLFAPAEITEMVISRSVATAC